MDLGLLILLAVGAFVDWLGSSFIIQNHDSDDETLRRASVGFMTLTKGALWLCIAVAALSGK